MVSYDELKKGARIIIDGQPYEITESSLMFKGRGHSTLTARLKNLISGNMLSRTFQPSDSFKKAELKKIKAKFIYSHREKYFFSELENPSKRFDLDPGQIGETAKFLKTNQELEALEYQDRIISIILPIKISLKVKESPPGVKGDRSQSGTKQVVLETGAVISAPLFIETGDVIEINSETGQYARRIE